MVVALFVARRIYELRKVWIHLHRPSAVADVGHHLEPGPSPRVARHGDGGKAVVEDLLGVAGEQRGNGEIHQAEIALMRDGRTLGVVVIAGEHQGRTVARCTRKSRMPEDVARTIETRTLAVPDADDAVPLVAGDHVLDLG